MITLKTTPLTRAAFAPFGDLIEIDEALANHPIDGSTTQRFHDLGTATVSGTDARVAFSMMRATPSDLPLTLKMVERHPFGSQAFVPVSPTRFLVVVAPDENGRPGTPRAFLAKPGQGINYHAGVWHGALTALDTITDFLVVDRIGKEDNCEIFTFETPYRIG